MTPIKIAFLITLPELGGAQSHVAQILARLDRQLFEPVLITAGRGWLTEQAEALGIRAIALKHLRRAIRPGADLLAFAEIWRILRRERPHVLHIHSSKAGILGRLAGRLARVPRIVFTAHGFSFHEALKPSALTGCVWLEKRLAPCADVIVPVSDYDRERALSFGLCPEDKLLRIYNGIDVTAFDTRDRLAPRTALEIGGQTIALGMVARFAFPKDQRLLIRAVARLAARHPAIRLLLIGSGPELPQAVELARTLGIADRVVFLGDRTDVPDLLTALDVFVLSSHFEALPISIIEAMAAGLPVVASRVGGVAELVADGETGLCVPPDNLPALTNAIERLVADAPLRQAMGTAGRNRARARFDASTMLTALQRVYQF